MYVCTYKLMQMYMLLNTPMYVFSNVYLYVYVYYVSAYVLVSVHVYVYAYVYVYIYIDICTCICICTCACICLCVHVHVYMHMYLHKYTYMHMHVCMYMHACTHMCLHPKEHIPEEKVTPNPRRLAASLASRLLQSSGQNLLQATLNYRWILNGMGDQTTSRELKRFGRS